MSGPFLCPRYDEFRYWSREKGIEVPQYCPHTGFFISGTADRRDRWYRSCSGCQRLSGIIPAPVKKNRKRKGMAAGDDVEDMFAVFSEDQSRDDDF